MGSGSSTARQGAQQQRQLIEAELEINSLKEKVEEGRMEKLRLENQRLWRELQQTKDAEARRREDAMQAELAQLRLQVHSKELAQAQSITPADQVPQSPLAQSPLAGAISPIGSGGGSGGGGGGGPLRTGYFHHHHQEQQLLQQPLHMQHVPTSARQLGRPNAAFATTGGYHGGGAAVGPGGAGQQQFGRYGGSASAPQSARYHSYGGYGMGGGSSYGQHSGSGAGARDAYRPPLPAGPPPPGAVSARSTSSRSSHREAEWRRASRGAQQRQRYHSHRRGSSGSDTGSGNGSGSGSVTGYSSARGDRSSVRNGIVVPRLAMPVPPPEPSVHPLLQQARGGGDGGAATAVATSTASPPTSSARSGAKRQHQQLSSTPPSSSRGSRAAAACTITTTTTSITSSKAGAQPVRSPLPIKVTGTDAAVGKRTSGARQRRPHEAHGREARLRRESARARERARMRHDVMHISDDEDEDEDEDGDEDGGRDGGRIDPAVRPAAHVPSLRERMSNTTVSKRLSQHRLEQLRKISATDSSEAGSSYGSDTDSDGGHCGVQGRGSHGEHSEHERARTGSGEEGRMSGASSSRSSASSTAGPAAGTRRRPQPKSKRRKMGDLARQHCAQHHERERLQPLSSRTALRSTEKWSRVTNDRPAPAYTS